jgi:tRNA G26 N,N-dimethylase Trm1
VIDTVTTTRRSSSTGQQTRVGHRRQVSVPARLTWRDASGTLRFVSVVMRDVSEVDAFVECQVPASIPLYRLVHFQVERPSREGQDLPAALREGKVLSAVYRVGPYKTSTGTPSGYALRLLVEPKTRITAARDREALALAN